MLPDYYIEELINGVFSGEISPFKLPVFLYSHTVNNLDTMFFSGYGDVPRGVIKEAEKAVNFRANIGRFSGAKTFQEVKTLTEYAFDENGKKRPFSEFKKKALKIDSTYNKNWLRTEQDSVFSQSQNARKWVKIEAEKDIFPVLQYVTVGDDRVRDSHARLDGLKLQVNDPLWNDIMPQNSWNCRCTVIQLEQTITATKREKESHTKLIKKDFKKDPTFQFNPGKEDYIFKESGKGKHDYFKVPRQFEKDLRNNFGFPSVTEVTGKTI